MTAMPMTLAEKIIARAAGKDSVRPGEIVTCRVDLAMMHDSGGPRRVKPILERLGGFDERFPLAWREDSDLHFRMLQIGAQIVHAPDAAVVHPIRPAPWGVSLRQQKKVMFDVLLYRQHRFLYRRRIRGAPRWDYHIAAGALLATPAAAALGAPGLALAAGAVWLAITAALAAKRLRHTSRRLGHVMEMIVTSALIPPLAVFWRIAGAVRYRAWLA